MKKVALFSAVVLLNGCACVDCPQKNADTAAQPVVIAVEEPVVVQTAEVAVPVSYACTQTQDCAQKNKPTVLKPRVTEKLSQKRKRRCCPDEPVLPGQEDKVYVPDAPEIYVISANRTVNSMQQETSAFFEQAGAINVYVDEAITKSDDLPGGSEQGTKTLKKRFAQIENVTVVEDREQADFVVNSVIDWYDTASKTVPAIKYDLFLNTKNNHVLGEWSEIIHQAEGDRSWW